MVDLSDPKGPVKEGIDNTIFVVPGIIVISLVCKYRLTMKPPYDVADPVTVMSMIKMITDQ